MRVTETIRYFFSLSLFNDSFNKKLVRNSMTFKSPIPLPSSTHRKIHLICGGQEYLKRECYREVEQIFQD
jgi:hypothetical protein